MEKIRKCRRCSSIYRTDMRASRVCLRCTKTGWSRVPNKKSEKMNIFLRKIGELRELDKECQELDKE